jgi:hypothetical protein
VSARSPTRSDNCFLFASPPTLDHFQFGTRDKFVSKVCNGKLLRQPASQSYSRRPDMRRLQQEAKSVGNNVEKKEGSKWSEFLPKDPVVVAVVVLVERQTNSLLTPCWFFLKRIYSLK